MKNLSLYYKCRKGRLFGLLASMLCLWLPSVAVAQDFYVTPDGKVPVDCNGEPIGGAWSDAAKLATLETALRQAQPGQSIWVQGFDKIERDGGRFESLLYKVPREGLVLKAGVRLYGGFKGNETSLEERATLGRAFDFIYRSVFVGDLNLDDVPDREHLISSSNPLRADNAWHVLTMDLDNSLSDNKNEDVSVLDGFTVVGGHAPEYGGGVRVKGHDSYSCAYRIERCFFFNNYAGKQGGAVYVDANAGTVTSNASYINQCVVYNNAAGLLTELANNGGGIYVAGKGTVVNTSVFNNENGGVCISPQAGVLNSTIARNTVAGVDLTSGGGADGPDARVVNSVVWGNTALFSEFTPGFRNSSYHEVAGEGNNRVDEFGNVYVSDKNNDRSQASPFFSSPSLTARFDRDFKWVEDAYPLWNWQPLEGSAFIGRGDSEAYEDVFGLYDLGAAMREVDLVDIGAYEFQPVPEGRILRVSPDGDDANDGSSWDKAYRNVQAAIDRLAAGGQGGEVWVRYGVYQPSVYMSGMSGDRTAAFVMKDGVSVYGGFEGNEATRAERDAKKSADAMPWEYPYETVFAGSGYMAADDGCKYNTNTHKWSVTGSNSNHVVWFAGTDGTSFNKVTVLEGVTIKGGAAKESVPSEENFFGDRGAGVYMVGNAYLTNCVVTENEAVGNGGGVYLSGGRIIGSLLYNNEGYKGGAVHVDNSGMVLRSMLTNNSAYDGAAVYMLSDTKWTDGTMRPEYLILSTSVVSNNTSRRNGAVYFDRGGVMLQTTLVNNVSVGAIDHADSESARTGGLYVKGYGLSVNSVIWNNLVNGRNVPMYAVDPTVATVRFINMAVSGINNSIWNNVLQQDMLSLVEANSSTEDESVTPDFEESGMPSAEGVDGNLKRVDYFWLPVTGSNLRSSGRVLGRFPEDVVLAPELDIRGNLFAQKPSVGAVMVEKRELRPDDSESGVWRLYVNTKSMDATHDGSSWEKAYRSINEAIEFFATAGKPDGVDRFEILVHEGDCHPRYSFVNLDPKTATIHVLKTELPLAIRGGYRFEGGSAVRKPLEYRSVIDGNPEGQALEDGLYHCISVQSGAQVEIDGFHVVGGYAVSSTYKRGAGLLSAEGADVTVRNTVFENNTAASAAAVSAPDAMLTMVNCVVNNNTNTMDGGSVVEAGTLTLQHVTVVNNEGGAPVADYGTSFSAGNTNGSNDTQKDLNTLGAEGAVNFANPTNKRGATLGYDTYLGGYSEFRPLTSSADAALLVNKAARTTGLTEDITGKGRDLGGMPDLGAYEADLPASGRVYYVRMPEKGGSDRNDGLSWETAFATVRKAVEAAYAGSGVDGQKPQVWVAAGTYSQDPESRSQNCFEILEGVNVYGAFPNTGTPGMGERHPFISTAIYHDGTYDPADYETILQPQTQSQNQTRRVLGQADMYNPINSSSLSFANVGEGNGDYIWEEEHYEAASGGGYYYSPNGGEYVDALASYVNAVRLNAGDYYKAESGHGEYKYCTKADREASEERNGPKRSFVEVGDGYGSYSISQEGWFQTWYKYTERQGGGYEPYDPGVQYYEASPALSTHRKAGETRWYTPAQDYVSRDICTHLLTVAGYNEVSEGYGTHKKVGGSYVYVGDGKGNFQKSGNRFTIPTTWDGFTLTKGYINSSELSYLDSNGKRNGGAGALIFTNVTLANSIVYGNTNSSTDTEQELRGGGVYCDEGTLVNCYIKKNTLGRSSQYTAYGGGGYLYDGTAYNCVLAGNTTVGQHTDGGAFFIENGEFFNNTVVGNRSEGTTRGNGGICVYNKAGESDPNARLLVYNCISVGNEGYRGELTGNKDLASNGGKMTCYNSISENITNSSNGNVQFENCQRGTTALFENYAEGNFHLRTGSVALNMGENMVEIGGDIIDLFDFTDMDFTDRVKDCTVDAGAYERRNEDMVEPDNNGVYYVTFNGNGTADASSPADAACAMMLQEVLDAAGERAAAGVSATVKVAGYRGGASVYHPNTLSNPNDPKSYTFVVPEGVTVMGGYNEGTYNNGEYQNDGNWNKDDRDATEFMTVLSAVCDATAGRQAVNGYHVVQFGTDGMSALGKPAVLDGVFLEDGSATASSGRGNANTRGGGAIVPANAHVRNCVVRYNEAVDGGGLFVLPGGLVSGCGVTQNKAGYGGGMYLSAEGGVTDSNRAHVISGTVTENSAAESGGGLYLEDGAALFVNSVVWGNTAPGDKNISGVPDMKYPDAVFAGFDPDVNATGGFYPFNNCFVETYEMPGNYGGNKSLESEHDLYFSAYYIPRPFSVLVKGGAVSALQKYLVTNRKVAEHDMQGIPRVQLAQPGNVELESVDAGAYAYLGGGMRMPTTEGEVIRKLFVSQGENVELTEGDKGEDYLNGRSFYTALASLDEALDYIDMVRNTDFGKEIAFEIWVAEGTYKPRNARADADPVTGEPNQRQNSFVIPKGVRVFGGFSGKENYAYGVETLAGKTMEDLQGDDGTRVMEILNQRESGDLNANGISEPWEMARQTILSGHVNLSALEKNVYHVLYSKEGTQPAALGGITLDGLTVMDGETFSEMRKRSEVGMGGGLYTVGVDYTLVRCRFLNNKAVRGGAVYALNANVTSVGTLFAGNGTVENGKVGEDAAEGGLNIRGGALYLAGTDRTLKAVNTLWVNNGTDSGTPDNLSWGGALAVAGGATVNLMNNTFVRNKAGEFAAVYVEDIGGAGSRMVNTAVWGNESQGVPVNLPAGVISHSASDMALGEGALVLHEENNAVNGPRFSEPTGVSGTEGYLASAKWDPIAISVLVDAGDGTLAAKEENPLFATGGYKDWMSQQAPDYAALYMGGSATRYAGPKDENGEQMDKTIDIGVFEYQYPTDLSGLDIVYVATTESGRRDGTSWDNATSDLRGALNAMANATDAKNTNKEVRVKSGTYTMGNNLLTNDIAYLISMSGADNTFVTSLTVNGSYDESGVQDFSQPTVLTGNDSNKGSVTLLNVFTNGKPVTVSGLAFHEAGVGMNATTTGDGKLTVRNAAFRQTATTGMAVGGTGKTLVANALFADGQTGLAVSGGGMTVVNATFAHNAAAGITGQATVHNSVAWKSGNAGFSDGTNHNKDLGEAENTALETGPNFVDPDHADVLKRDYSIRPGFTLLNQGADAVYTSLVADPAADKDLAGNGRKVGGCIDVGAYEYTSDLNRYVYVKKGVAGSDNSGSDWDNAMEDLQGAVDLATVYANINAGKKGYVFVHRNVAEDAKLRLAHGGVNVYGGMVAGTVTESVTVEDVLNARGSLLEADTRSMLRGGVAISGESVVDGFEVSGPSHVAGGGMLSTSILASDTEIGADGTLYNVLVDDSGVTGAGKAVNVTSTVALGVAGKYKTAENAGRNKYVGEGYWAYQPNENSVHIDDASSDSETKTCMAMAGHSMDLAGNKRVRGLVDNGCFEVWNIAEPVGEVLADDYPHGKSVVYVRKGNELCLKRSYTEAGPFNPGFLLLEHGAGLWGGGNHVALDNFATERELTEANGYKDLVVVPFRVDRVENISGVLDETNVFKYDGKARAAYDYKFNGSEGGAGAWKPMDAVTNVTEGLLLETEAPATVRFYGTEYVEDGNPKPVVLMKYNFNSPWSTPSDPGPKFTHKENMSWNLFGSPYLCTMNYEDMEYGRVVYGYEQNGYYTQPTATWQDADGTAVAGNIPVGSAVFTQSATLKETEVFYVKMRAEEIQDPTRATRLAVRIAPAADKRDVEAGVYDELQLEAVPTEEALAEFDLARDGVKWMNDNGEPEIFAVRDGGRYSLLSAIDREGTIGVGVSLPEAGMYSIGIPEDCEAGDYEYVILKDAATGKAVDLKEGAYSFRTAEAGVAEGRFTLSFKRMDADQRHDIYVKSGMGKATVFGVADGDAVTVVTVDGKIVATEEATGNEVAFVLARGAYLFKVAGADGRATVVKAMVR